MKQMNSAAALSVMALVRIAIGCHFLYEGVAKILDPRWSAGPFLAKSVGPFAKIFQALAAEKYLGFINFTNKWGLVLIGAALMLGLFTRVASVGGILLLALYSAAYVPVSGETVPGQLAGFTSNLVEMAALLAVTLFPARALGLDGLIEQFQSAKAPARAGGRNAGAPIEAELDGPESRRSVLASLVGFPVVGAFALVFLKYRGWRSHEEKNLDAYTSASAKTAEDLLKPTARTMRPMTGPTTGPTISLVDTAAVAKSVKGTMPQASIGKLKLSRMILGGNLIGGWAHARDLIYVSSLVKKYHNREKVFETFQIAEACGVNAILTNPMLCPVIVDYWKTTGGKINFISDCGSNDVVGATRKSIDNGAAACYVQGGEADKLVEQGKFDVIARALEVTRAAGLPAGIGAHRLETVQACVEKGLIPDFWMKTLHEHTYWSARPEVPEKPDKDHNWCRKPAETIAFMKTRPEPWIAFKTLAAGAIHPKQGFKFALQNGADFICVGMYDFQIVDDVNLAIQVLSGDLKRERPWRAVEVA